MNMIEKDVKERKFINFKYLADILNDWFLTIQNLRMMHIILKKSFYKYSQR